MAGNLGPGVLDFPEVPGKIDLSDLARLLKLTEAFANDPDSNLTLYAGLIEKAAGIREEKDFAAREEEVGDLLCYLAKIANFYSKSSFAEIIGANSLDEFQDDDSAVARLPIIVDGCEISGGILDSINRLYCRVIRVIDALNRSSPELWEGIASDRRTLENAIYDTLVALKDLKIEGKTIRLNDAMRVALEKLYARECEDQVGERLPLSSGRKRVLPYNLRIFEEALAHEHLLAEKLALANTPGSTAIELVYSIE